MDDFVLFGGHSFEDMVLTVQQEGSLHLVLQLHIVLRRQAETCPKTQKGKDFFETCHIHYTVPEILLSFTQGPLN